jgi:hypothetical protein
MAEPFDAPEEAILPSLSTALDSLLETAALARPGHDAEAHAAALRSLGRALAELAREVEALAPAAAQPRRSAVA